MTESTGTPRRKNPFWLMLDGLTWLLWKIVELPFLAVWLILRGIGEMFRGIWKAIGELDGAAWFWKPLNSFFQFLGKFLGVIFYVPVAVLRGIAGGMDKSVLLRRFLLFLLLVAAGIWAYLWGPQPAWGTWHPYYDAVSNRYADGMKPRKTTSGEWIWPKAVFSAGHPDLPPGTRILVENPDNGRKLALRVNDRRDALYLSDAAAWKLGIHVSGVTMVKVYTRRKLLSDPEPEIADPNQAPGEWEEELKEVPFQVETPKPPPEPPKPPPEPEAKPVPAPVVTPKPVPKPPPEVKPPPAPKPPPKPKPKPPPQPKNNVTDDRLELSDPVLVPDRKRR